ncbi:MAG TPA: CbiX/SirB N-terminal domain-containing protein [Blastocatellia bacterium]|nr:CbiX/SirB N-terminal domain-containing protein [Blastocatellia bacterium]
MSVLAQGASNAVAKRAGHPPRALEVGLLLLAHGGTQNWNEEVNRLAQRANQTMPVEVAFGMATKRNLQEAINRLTARGIREIVTVPLFVSSHSSVITATQYLLGLRETAPPELAVFAKMSHGHGDAAEHHDHGAPGDEAAMDPTTPVKSPVPIRWSRALDDDPVVSEILLSRASSISQTPAREVVIVVAHGPVSDEDNAKWLADMERLVRRMRKASHYKRIEYLTVRDDAPEPVRSQATAELRRVVERASAEESRVLIVPLLLSYGGIEKGLKKRLEGLNYTMSTQALLPDDRLIQWTLLALKRRTP